MSKSMVLPKPWQRGQAPKGELKLKRIGSGTENSRPQVLHWNFSLKRSSLVAGCALEDQFAGLAVADLDGVDEALMHVGPDGQTVDQEEDGLREIDVEERLGGGEFENLAVLEEAIEALLAELEEVVAEGLRRAVIAARGRARTSANRRAIP